MAICARYLPGGATAPRTWPTTASDTDAPSRRTPQNTGVFDNRRGPCRFTLANTAGRNHNPLMTSRTALYLAAKPAKTSALAWCVKQVSRLVALGADLDDSVAAVVEAQGEARDAGRITWIVWSADLTAALAPAPVESTDWRDVPPPY